MQKESLLPSTAMKGKLRYLTVSMALVLVLSLFLLEIGIIWTIILNILISAVCFFGVYAVGYSRKNLVIALVFGLPWFVMSWVDILITTTSYSTIDVLTTSPSAILGFISTIFLTLFFTFTAIVILSFVLESEQVSGDILYGAVSIYLFIGGIFNMIYLLIETLHPGSFFNNINGTMRVGDFTYYSFITLTTLGYGDIIPVTSYARSFTVLEGIIGVMYLAIIISRLVGLYIATSTKNI